MSCSSTWNVRDDEVGLSHRVAMRRDLADRVTPIVTIGVTSSARKPRRSLIEPVVGRT